MASTCCRLRYRRWNGLLAAIPPAWRGVIPTAGKTLLPPVTQKRVLYIRYAAVEKALPFEPLVPNPEAIEAMKEARRGNLESFDSVDSLMANLNAKD
jgi:hypothetical protein